MVKLGALNSRMKDFVDIWLLSRSFDFDGPSLSDAIEKTFNGKVQFPEHCPWTLDAILDPDLFP